jgi:hypothetical protein
MPAVVFLTHVPLLRLAEDDVPFAGGELTRLPWEQYDMLSQGAFSDFQRLYEETAPVFYRVDLPDLQVPPVSSAPSTGGMIEFSAPSGVWESMVPAVGLGFLLAYSANVVDPAWTALLVAAPAAAPAWPRLSVTFAVRGDDATSFEFQGQNFDGARVDGDADQQLLFSPRAAGTEIPRETVEHADRLVPLIETAARHRQLAAAIAALQGATHPSLSAAEQTTLSVIALEALLLPEVVTGLGATFARRVATLLAPEDERKQLERAARALYNARSASVHGSPERTDAAALGPAYAQRLLAASIEELAGAVGEDGDLAAVCAELDEGRAPTAEYVLDPASVAGLQAVDRLSARTPKIAAGISFEGTATMAPDEGTRLSWSPLVGLTCEGTLEFGGNSGVVLTSRDPSTILTIEDKDVRRELGNVMLIETPVACLGISRSLADDEAEAVAQMLRTRDLAVVALRLAGLSAFVDPELLGSYVFEGVARTIDTTAFSQTILRGMGKDPAESFAPDDVGRFSSDWQLVAEYDARARHDEVDHVLTLYRRAHDAEFLPPDVRAGLLVALVEAMLGRFRPPDDPVQLEALVLAVAGDADPTATWFAQNARAFRNAVAHGYWDRDPEPLAVMQTLLRPLVRAFLLAWLAEDNRERRPERAFIDSVAAAVER